MFKSIFKLLKRITLSIALLFSYNMVTSKFNLTIPINIYTISILTFFKTPGFISLILFYILNYR